jgi:amino acid transporter
MQWKRWLLGAPLSSERAHEEKLTVPRALAVFASDALSSVAYATEEILKVLVVAGAAAATLPIPIAIGIAALLWLLIISYRQTILKYPAGGGAYNVASDNLGDFAGLVAGSSLLVDYILTVSVSVSAGVLAITSAAPALRPYAIELNVIAIIVVALMNLRGTRESASIFSIPPYLFILGLFSLIGVGLFQIITTGQPAFPPEIPPFRDAEPLTLFLILHAFAGGCTALTGVEAISNGVPAFKNPAPINARTTLLLLGILSTILFGGITVLAQVMQVHVSEESSVSVLALINGAVFGTGSIPFWLIQIFTFTILILAANTAFNGFPLLASLMARDSYLPRQFNNVGDRLVFSNGIVILAVAAMILNVIFKGDVGALIPLYAIGVFLSFTLSQAGMVKRWLTRKEEGWQLGLAISGAGGLVSLVVLGMFAVVKFTEGAWVVLILIPLLIWMLSLIKRHYSATAEQLSLATSRAPTPMRRNLVIVPVGTIHRGVVRALEYANSLSPDVKAVFIAIDQESRDKILKKWETWGQGIELEIIDSPYRSTTGPLFEYIRRQDNGRRDEVITVVIPEFVASRWWQQILHNQTALALKLALLARRNTVVISVPFHLDE